jgi:formylglycine-generating enzyme required for sulfatase activity
MNMNKRCLNRRAFVATGAWAVGSAALTLLPTSRATGGGFAFKPGEHIIPAPRDPAEWPTFRQQLSAWRERLRRDLNYSDALYRRSEFAWVQQCFSCGFVMLCDETFYDSRAGRYTVETFLDEGVREFGGFDAIVLWHAYPRIGLDDRNQFDFYRDMPGGWAGLRQVADICHRRGVRVFIDYNPWDTGTRREGRSDLEALAETVQAIDADGIFLDTLDRGAAEWRDRLDAVRPGVALESEIALPVDRVHDHHLSWAQWFADSEVPGVLRNKWFERRHLQHQIRRWDRDHSGELHAAWMNGSGVLVWENVFGTWNGWCQRDREMLRAMLPIQRRFAELFSGERWTPLIPSLAPDVYASLWEGEGIRLWTLANRQPGAFDGPLLDLELSRGEVVYDLVRGQPADLDPGRRGPRLVRVRGRLAGRGLGCLLAAQPQHLGQDFRSFLREQRRRARRAVATTDFPARHVVRVPASLRSPPAKAPEGMVEIPAWKGVLATEFRVRECGFYDSTHEHWNRSFPPLHGTKTFERRVALGRWAMDLTPVTNAQFAEFLRATRWRPRHPENFLKHWPDWRALRWPEGWEAHPVVYVDLEDARAYARWAGKRLPTEDEWQFAAQGPQALKYPWGDAMLPDRCNGGETDGLTPVTQYPAGRSPFGCYDLCGNVWEWTESERHDGRTRFAILKGGCWYRAEGSDWYFDGGPRANAFAAKMLLMWPGVDRCATVGFRCASELAG